MIARHRGRTSREGEPGTLKETSFIIHYFGWQAEEVLGTWPNGDYGHVNTTFQNRTCGPPVSE
jgi:hypothetical protein